MYEATINARYMDGTYEKEIDGDVPAVGALLVQLAADFLNENAVSAENRERLFDNFISRIGDILNRQGKEENIDEQKNNEEKKSIPSVPDAPCDVILFSSRVGAGKK